LVTLNPIHDLVITHEGVYQAAHRSRSVKVNAIASATVRMSRETAFDTCDIEFPNHKAFTSNVFNEEDSVELKLGYRNAIALAPVFVGKIKGIKPGLPLKISCESRGATTLKGEINKLYEDSTWKEIASDVITTAGLIPKIAEVEPPARPRKNFRISGQTPAQVLNYAAKETRWDWYLIPGTDECWFGPYDQEHAKEEINYRFIVGMNVFSENCELIYRSRAKRVKAVRVVLTDSQWQSETVIGEYYADDYNDGDYVLPVEKDDPSPTVERAEEIALAEYRKSARSGFEGKFTAVGNPMLQQGSRIAISDPKHDGAPFLNTVGITGAKREEEIGEYFDSLVYRYATVEEVTHNFGNGEYLMDVKVAGGYSE
jgi:hypothetical protein